MQQYLAGTLKHIPGVYVDIANAEDAEKRVTADETALDAAWGLSVHAPIGAWTDTYAVVAAGPLKGQRFSNPVVVSFYDASTGTFSSTDGRFSVTGERHGSTLTATIGGSGYVSHIRGTMAFHPDGSAAWAGTWSDSNGNSGTWQGTRKAQA